MAKAKYTAVFLVGGHFTKDGIEFLTDVKNELAKQKRVKVTTIISNVSRDLKQERPFTIRLLAQSEDAIQDLWRRYVNRVNLISSFERIAHASSAPKWMSWSSMKDERLAERAERTILITWRKEIDPWTSTPSKPVVRTEQYTELLNDLSLESLISKAGPGLRLVK
jgi:hypothetical protein